MTTFNVLPPFPVFFGRDGKPLEAGYVFIGELNQNPEDEEQEKAIFWDAALTIPAAQPVRTIGGYPSRAGSPSQVFVDGKFSLTVRDKNMQMVYTVGDAAALNPDAILTAADVVLAEAAAAIAVAAAVDAETAKDGAETAETNAAASAAAAATSETNAETAEDNAAASAAAAFVSEGNAAASETATEALFEDFDTRYLGAKASAPTLDNEGNALQTGAVYFNSTSDTLFVWDGATWSPAVFDTAGALFAVNNLSDVANAATSRANIGLQYASEAEAEAGTSNIRAMTPLRTSDAIAAQRPVSTDPDFTVAPTSLADRETIADYVVGRDLQGGTLVATTSGTAFDFTSIPAQVQEIDVIFDGVNLSGTDDILVQVGTSGGVVTTGYLCAGVATNGADGGRATSTSGMLIRRGAGANICHAVMSLKRLAPGSSIWVQNHSGRIGPEIAALGGGRISLGAELDRVRVTRTGSNTFSAGNLNVRWR
jgi:hypothetical protein